MTDQHATPSRPPEHDAERLARRFTTGVLLADDVRAPVRFVRDPATGALIVPIPIRLLDAVSHTVCLPDDTVEQEIALLVELSQDADEVLRDRHLAYHARECPGEWVTATIIGGKHCDGTVVPAEAFNTPDPLADHQPALCKALNADRGSLANMCEQRLGVRPDGPVCVGVDRHGLDVRARFDVLRLEFDTPADSLEAAQHVTRAWLGGNNA